MPREFPDAPGPDHATAIGDPARLKALSDTALVGSLEEAAFDRAVRLIRQITGVPTALFSLVDEGRQYFKAHTGLPPALCEPSTPLSHSFCQYVVSSDTTLAVGNSRTHALLKDNGATRELDVVAYLGVPVRAPNGKVLGSLCAIDSSPREWTHEDESLLADLAAMLETEIALREEVAGRLLLLQEMNHRVKNVFAMISGMVRMGARGADDLKGFSDTLTKRINALAAAHELIMPKDADSGIEAADVSLQSLAAMIVDPHVSGAEERITITGPPVCLSPKAATNIALVLHELGTNAAKYGALSGTEGTLRIAWEIGDGTLRLTWSEHLPEANCETGPGAGFGSQLLNLIVTRGLDGSLDVDRRAEGYRYALAVSLAVLYGDA